MRRACCSRTVLASAGTPCSLKDNKLHYVSNFLGIKPEQVFVSGPLPEGKHALGMEFKREGAPVLGQSVVSTVYDMGTTILIREP